ncbi:hypothetical protein ACFPC0_11070 [Streptomyces andamanensis]|uniref:Uncharacterized protein n=1 Tax=Streptomyces andamanensis TaxID=1565035 RepID=A0ABV8TCW1_9ACTN
MRRRMVTEAEAVARLLAAGYTPLEPYPGSTSIAWRMQCKTCKAERSIRLNSVKRSVCKHERRLLDTHEQASIVLAEAGYEPVSPYPGSSTLDWQVKCRECGEERTRPLRALRQHPCIHRASPDKQKAEAEAEMRSAGFKPLEPYPGIKTASWKTQCVTCGQPRRVRLRDVEAGYRCGHRGAAGGAEDEAMAAGYEPMEPYPGRAAVMWKTKCVLCGQPRTVNLSMIRAGRRCGHLGMPHAWLKEMMEH